tara:strand:+ start:923 stop:1120 length:198 start_codon:yes stop_codon:yes gene_type:complete
MAEPLSSQMNEVSIETQFVVAIITFTVFYFLIKQILKNISSTNDNGDKIIDLNKLKKIKEKTGSE